VLDQYARDHGKRPPLPPVISVVLHPSEVGWTGAFTLQELFDPEPLAIDGRRELLPNMRLVLDDISHASDAALMACAVNEFAVAVPVVLWVMRDARNVGQLMRSGVAGVADHAAAGAVIAIAPGGRKGLSDHEA